MKNLMLITFCIIPCYILAQRFCPDQLFIKLGNSAKSDMKIWDSLKISTNHYDYLSFMINHTNSRYFDVALTRYFYFQELLWDSIGPPRWECFDRCISIIITKSDTVLFESELNLIEDLNKKALTYLINENNEEGMPKQRLVEDINGVKRYVSNGFFYLQTDLESSEKLKKGINEIKLAYKNYKNYLSEKWFRVKFDKLDSDKKKLIDNLVIQSFEIGRSYKIIFVEESLKTEDF